MDNFSQANAINGNAQETDGVKFDTTADDEFFAQIQLYYKVTCREYQGTMYYCLDDDDTGFQTPFMTFSDLKLLIS